MTLAQIAQPDRRVTTVAVVCGYRELETLPQYVAALAPLLISEEPAFAILSGGRTAPGARASEAAVMGELTATLCPAQPFLLDEQAMTTLENLLNARQLARKTFGRVSRWIVFCDRAHRTKVAVLARIILGANVTVYAVPRACTLRVRLLEGPTLIAESCAALIPALRPLVRTVAMWWRGVSAPSDAATAAARR